MKVLVDCSRCWRSVELRHIDKTIWEGECSHCMVTLGALLFNE